MSINTNNNGVELQKLIELFNFIENNDCAIPGEKLYEENLQRLKDFFCADVNETIEMLKKLDFNGDARVIILYSPHIVKGFESEDDKIKFIHALEDLKKNYETNPEVRDLFDRSIFNCRIASDIEFE